MTGVVVDTSALVAILLDEVDGAALKEAMLRASPRLISAFTILEAHVVMSKRVGLAGPTHVDAFVAGGALQVVAFTAEHLALARAAYDRFGKGRHEAALNLGDCCAYALARRRGLPLLAKGDDFALTDIARA